MSFDLGAQDTPVKVTLGRQQALDGGVANNPQVRPLDTAASTVWLPLWGEAALHALAWRREAIHIPCIIHGGAVQAMNESALSGSLNLGHYGVTQSNSFESVDVNGHGAQLVTPFAKLQLPYKVLCS